MNTKILDISDIVVPKVSTSIHSTKERTEETKYEIADVSSEIKSIGVHRKQNKIFTYLNLFIKRIADILGSLVGIIFLIPITIIVAIVNALNKDYGPIFYSHKRIGKNGNYFKMYKFRTMVVDADKKLSELLENDEEARKEWDMNRKLKNDPRITKIGKILRKTSIDEFPQFINVLKGEMSLVGPRAVIDGEIEKFGIYKKDILSVKPGITGYWAANGRSSTSYDERVFLEYKYVENFSIFMDVKILIKTVVSVLKKEGAV